MDGKNKAGSSSSITAELFGTKESPPSSSAGIFASIFPPPSGVAGRTSSSDAMANWQKQPTGTQTWHNKQGTAGTPNKDRSSVFHEEGAEPCHLSSSLYYGGQDVFSQFSTSQIAKPYPIFKDGAEDDPNGNSASRGNWWQGSLYY